LRPAFAKSLAAAVLGGLAGIPEAAPSSSGEEKGGDGVGAAAECFARAARAEGDAGRSVGLFIQHGIFF